MKVVLEVTDEGPGLSESDMEKIFMPLYAFKRKAHRRRKLLPERDSLL